MTEARCPECGKPALAPLAPFCSVRCQQVDLGRWLKGDFVIPGKPEEEGDGRATPIPDIGADEE